MNRIPQLVLIASTLLGSWLGMQLAHELGHVAGAFVTGGQGHYFGLGSHRSSRGMVHARCRGNRIGGSVNGWRLVEQEEDRFSLSVITPAIAKKIVERSF